MRVLTILVRFGTELYPRAEQEIADVFQRQMPEVERNVLVVDNALPTRFVEQGDRRVLVGGDNTSREFSAFDRGVQHIGSDIWRYDLVHLATEAFNTLYTSYLARFDTPLLKAVTKHPVCVGHIDCYNEPVEILGIHTQHWIRSCFIFLPPTEVKALGSLVSVRDRNLFFGGAPDAPFLPNAPLNLRYQEYITDWLTGRDIGQGVTWHSSFALTHEKLPSFEAKAAAIMNEQLLGIRLRAMGCRLVDVTWLATMLAKGARADLHTNWREQLAGRDRDALVVSSRPVVTVPGPRLPLGSSML